MKARNSESDHISSIVRISHHLKRNEQASLKHIFSEELLADALRLKKTSNGLMTKELMYDVLSVLCRYREKKINTAEFKAVARLATHELYKGSAQIGSEEWHEREKHIVRTVLRDLRAA